MVRRLFGILMLGMALGTAAEIPAGTDLPVRLRTAVSTADAKPGQAVEGVIIAPVLVAGQAAIAPGVLVRGQVESVGRAETPRDRDTLLLEFTQLRDGAGKTATIHARVTEVDNARESVEEDGRIQGIVAAQTGSARLDQGIGKLAERFPGFSDILNSAKSVILQPADASISYGPGVEMTVQLTKPVHWSGEAVGPEPKGIEPRADVIAMVSEQPSITYAVDPPKPTDITNLIFLGTQEQLDRAFGEAGWTVAASLNGASKLETFRAIVEGRGYKEAPVSRIELEGRPPDLVYEKGNNTFAARHHLRIWRRPGSFDGKPIWVCAATHDIAIDLSETTYTFIHRIDSDIDRERAKVVSDLLFTKLVKGLALVDRPEIPHSGVNATGDPFRSDGRMAVVEF